MNKYQPHIYILPEDSANEKLANGFLLARGLNERLINVLRPAGGWRKVLEDFEQIHATEMNRYSSRHMILVIDFDEQNDRLVFVQEQIPPELKDRVFVLGVWSEPEKLKQLLNTSYEAIGEALAEGCPNKVSKMWNNELLKHNL